MKNSIDTIGNRTRDLPACSAVPQPTAPSVSGQLHYAPCLTNRYITTRYTQMVATAKGYANRNVAAGNTEPIPVALFAVLGLSFVHSTISV
jgi:hypothetical protein